MPKVYRLSEYKVLDYFVKHVDLEIDLTETPVKVRGVLKIIPNPASQNRANDLVLDGQNMTLTSVLLNDKLLTSNKDYEKNDQALLIKNVPNDSEFTLETITFLGENTDLFGLYETEGVVLVKAETEGLRRVFYCNDRPDNLASFKTTIIAKEENFRTFYQMVS